MIYYRITIVARGGKREGAGRPIGTKKEQTVVYYRRVLPEWVEKLDEQIEKLKGKKNEKSILSDY